MSHEHQNNCTCGALAAFIELQTQLKQFKEEVMTKLSELPISLDKVTDTLLKARDEINAAVAVLTGQLDALSTLTPEAEAALDRLSRVAQALDDMNPDAPPAPAPNPVEAPVDTAPALEPIAPPAE